MNTLGRSLKVFETYLEDGKQVYVTKTLQICAAPFLSVAFLMVMWRDPKFRIQVPGPSSVPMSTAARGE